MRTVKRKFRRLASVVSYPELGFLGSNLQVTNIKRVATGSQERDLRIRNLGLNASNNFCSITIQINFGDDKKLTVGLEKKLHVRECDNHNYMYSYMYHVGLHVKVKFCELS